MLYLNSLMIDRKILSWTMRPEIKMWDWFSSHSNSFLILWQPVVFYYIFFLPHYPSLSPNERNRLNTSILCFQIVFLLEVLYKEGSFCLAHIPTHFFKYIFITWSINLQAKLSLLRESLTQKLVHQSAEA